MGMCSFFCVSCDGQPPPHPARPTAVESAVAPQWAPVPPPAWCSSRLPHMLWGRTKAPAREDSEPSELVENWHPARQPPRIPADGQLVRALCANHGRVWSGHPLSLIRKEPLSSLPGAGLPL